MTRRHTSESLVQLLLLQSPPLKLIDDRKIDVSPVWRGGPLHDGTGLSPLLFLEYPHV